MSVAQEVAGAEAITYTYTDEAPMLATHAFYPIIQAFCKQADIPVQLRDISVAGRLISPRPEPFFEKRITRHWTYFCISRGSYRSYVPQKMPCTIDLTLHRQCVCIYIYRPYENKDELEYDEYWKEKSKAVPRVPHRGAEEAVVDTGALSQSSLKYDTTSFLLYS